LPAAYFSQCRQSIWGIGLPAASFTPNASSISAYCAVVRPDFGNSARTKLDDLRRWQPTRPFWSLQKLHSRLLWGTPAFARITISARRDNILPNRTASLYSRYDVVIREKLAVLGSTAVLAAKFIAHEYVRPGKLHASFLRICVAFQADHGWGTNCHVRRTNLVFVRFENIHLAQEAQRDGRLPGDYLMRRHPRREQQRLRSHHPPRPNHLFFFITQLSN
jgi:hypothetical protein